jgi:cytochrome P450
MTPGSIHDVPVAPGRLPLVGHAWQLAHRPLGFITDLYSCGRTKDRIVRVDLARKPVYVLTGAHLVQDVLVTKGSSFQRGTFFERVRPFLGDGLAMLSGEAHRRVRRLVQPAFSQAQLVHYAAVIAEDTSVLAKSWQAGEVVALDKVLDDLYIATLAKVMFSPTLSQATVTEIGDCLSRLTKAAILRAAIPKSLAALPLPMNRRFDTDAAAFHRIVDGIVAERRAARTGTGEPEDLLATLMAARDPDTGQALTDRQVRDQVIAILAGIENSGVVMTWAFGALAAHPEIRAQVEAEADAVTAGDPERRIGYHDAAKLEFTQRFLREITRLHALLMVMRRSTADVEIGGTLLPAGTDIAYSQYGMHRDPDRFPRPEVLDPDRWLPHEAKERPRLACIPFGAGAQKCIGDGFAWTEMLITLATITARWRLRPPGNTTVRQTLAVVPKPHAMPMIVEARKP